MHILEKSELNQNRIQSSFRIRSHASSYYGSIHMKTPHFFISSLLGGTAIKKAWKNTGLPTYNINIYIQVVENNTNIMLNPLTGGVMYSKAIFQKQKEKELDFTLLAGVHFHHLKLE